MKEGLSIITKSDGKSYSVRNHRDKYFYPDDWMKFYDSLRLKQKVFFNFLINTGARINEARNVRLGDIDFERNMITLRITKVKARKGEKHPRPRTIPISSQFSKFLRLYADKKKLNSDSYFGFSSTPAANEILKSHLEKLEIKEWWMYSIHNIRKTFETWLIALGIDGLKVTAHIGHSLDVAARNYVAADIFNYEDKLKIRMIIGDLYER